MTATGSGAEVFGSGYRALGPILAFLAGSAVVVLLINFWQSEQVASRLDRERTATRRRLVHIAQRLDPLETLPRHLDRVAEHLRQQDFSPAAFAGAQRLLQRAPVTVAEIYLFDGQGHLVSPRTANLRYRWLMQRFWDIQTGRLLPSGPEFLRCAPALRARLGIPFLASAPGRHPQKALMQRLEGDENVGYWYWVRPSTRDSRGFLALLEKPVPTARLLKSLFHGFRGSRGILFSREGGKPPVGVCGTASLELMARVSQRQRDFGEISFVQNDFLWQTLSLDDMTLFLGRPVREAPDVPWPGAVLLAFLGGMAGFAVFAFLARIEHISLLAKIPAIFLIGLALPGIGVAFFGWENLRNVRENAILRFEREVGDLINTLDRGLLREQERLKQLFRGLEQDEALARADMTAFSRRLQILADKGDIGLGQVFCLDPRRKPLVDVRHFCFSIPLTTTGDDLFTKAGLEIHLVDRLQHELASYVSEIPGTMLKIAKGPFSGVSEMMMRPGQVHSFSAGVPVWLYQRYFTRPGFPAGVLQVIVPLELVRWGYLRTAFRKRFFHRSWPILLGADNPAHGRRFSQTRAVPRALRALLFESRIRKQQVTGLFEWNQDSYLAVCLPGSKLDGFTLYALLPLRFLDREYAGIRDRLLVAILLLIALGAAIGMLLSRLFIRPIGHLSRGLAALRDRNRNFRIREIAGDELGELATSFNRFLETAEELELAGIIQHRLIPREGLTAGSYRIECRYLPATELAGDYVDFFTLADGRVVILIGDVSGHGVSSALLMAMVKGALPAALRCSQRPEAVLELLSRFVFDVMKRKLFMTFFFAILDPASHRMTFCNAGHPFPLLHGPKNGLRELGSPSLPLGASPKPKYHADSLCLDPGQTLLLFSDGLYEAVSMDGEAYGFDRINQFLLREGEREPDQLLTVLKSSFFQYIGDQPLADDVSLLVLKRSGAFPGTAEQKEANPQ